MPIITFRNNIDCKLLQPILTLFILCISILLGSIQSYALTESVNPPEIFIETFYKKYLTTSLENRHRITLPFSTSLNTLMQEDLKVCSEKAGSDVCGYDADMDIYLDTQEQASGLIFEHAGFKLSTPQPGIVSVTFNVYPSLKDKRALSFYQKTIQFKVIKEGNQWVVDNIIYVRKGIKESIRKKMHKEILEFSKSHYSA